MSLRLQKILCPIRLCPVVNATKMPKRCPHDPSIPSRATGLGMGWSAEGWFRMHWRLVPAPETAVRAALAHSPVAPRFGQPLVCRH
eukprot:gene14295-biopygen6568